MNFSSIPGSVTAPQGFLAAGVYCDIKRLGTGKGSQKGRKRDLGLIFSEVPAAAAGMFTTNQVVAAPVRLSQERVAASPSQCIVVNSGNANACTGEAGARDAEAMAAEAAKRLKLPESAVLVASTGRIGLPLPMPRVRRGIRDAIECLGGTPAHAGHAAEAILTSDTHRKESAVEFLLDGKPVRLGGICKGAGMIQPGMSSTGARPESRPLHATMLCFLTCDAEIEPAFLRRSLEDAVARSFNRITVDGDMSTNDTVILMANGMAGNRRLTAGRKQDRTTFLAALNHVTSDLARMIVKDGEGVTKFVTVTVSGARSFADADAAARAICNSSLVKTSWCGGDPNWGRILDALGYSAAKVDPDRIDVGYRSPGAAKVLWAVRDGCATRTGIGTLRRITRLPEFEIEIDLHQGRASAWIHASDLTEAYVDFNKGE